MYQLDAIRLTKNVHERLARFVRDDSFVRDPQLSKIALDIWGGTPEEGGLLSELWAEGAFPAKSADVNGKTTCLNDLVKEGVFDAVLRDELARSAAMPSDRPLYLHQADAIRREHDNRTAGQRPALVVTAGTGAGKTESFLLPMLNDLYANTPAHREGVECLILYPMNALVNDQVGRLYSWLEKQGNDPRCTLFHMTSETPEDTRAARDAKFEKFEPCRMRTRKEARGLETHEGAEIKELENRTAPPRILITNYSMLEYMLCRPQDGPFFGSNLRTIVLDEAHLYTGTLAAEMTLLLRRLLARCGKRPEDVLHIATSATIGGGSDTLKTFAAQLFSKDEARVQVIVGESDHVMFESMEPPAQKPTPEAICSAQWLDAPTLTQDKEGKTLLTTDESVCLALREPLRLLVNESTLKAAMDTAQNRPAVLLHEALVHAPLMQEAENLLWEKKQKSQALTISEFAAALFGRSDETTRQATTRLLQLGASARKEAYVYPVVPHRLHLLARTTAGLSVCLDPQCTGPAAHKLTGLGCVLEGVRERCLHCEAAAVTLVRCNHCGEWAIGGLCDGVRLRPIKERWFDGEMPSALKIYSLKESCGAKRQTVDRKGNIEADGIPIWESNDEKKRNTICLNCGEHKEWVPFITYDPYFLSTLAESVLSELPNHPDGYDEWLPAKGRRLLAFSDSRTEAARLGPRLTNSHELQVFRAAFGRALADSKVDPNAIARWEKKLQSEKDELLDSGNSEEVRQDIIKEIARLEQQLSNRAE